MEDTWKIQNSIHYIEKNLCENMKLEEIAKQSYFSEYHFHRLFRKIIGVSVMEYIRNRRLTEAAMELTETEEKITGIALKYQFSSEESFSRAFKKLYGISPRMYRNTTREVTCHRKANIRQTGSKLSSTRCCLAA